MVELGGLVGVVAVEHIAVALAGQAVQDSVSLDSSSEDNMSHLSINNGVVTNVTMGIDPLAQASVDNPGNVGIGWTTTDNVNFTAPVSPPAPSLGSVITQRAFKMRMTAAERIAIRTVAASNAAIYDFMDLLDASATIDLAVPTLLTDLTVLETTANPAGGTVLATGRAAAIVQAPVQASEIQ